MSKLDPRARFRMAMLLLVVLPVLLVWLFASIGETRIPEFVRMIFAAAYIISVCWTGGRSRRARFLR